MAWRSSGTTNDEMVNNLKRFGVIHSPWVEDGFRRVDRRFFVPHNRRASAHSDQPLKEGHVHISAPHIYGTVLEALELEPNSSLSFLNAGSGTGYLSCMVAEILGPTSISVGCDIHADVVEHSQRAMERWQANRPSSPPLPPMQVIHGNALEIDATQGECRVGFDRIYVGAALEKSSLSKVATLLKPGGILVGPVDDELVKVVRIGNDIRSMSRPAPPRSLRGHPPPLSDDFTQQILSGVRFSPLLQYPSIPVVIPSQIWSPENHKYFPDSFRKASKTLLLCSRTSPIQPRPVMVEERVNVAPMLPPALWEVVLSYTHRNWFEDDRPDEDFLRRRLMEEQLATQRAQEARQEAEARLQLVERERDVYRLLALRWQSRLQESSGQGGTGETGDDEDAIAGMEDIEEATAIFADEPLVLRLGGLRAMMGLSGSDDDEEEEEQEEETNHDDEHEAESEMEEDTAEMDETTEAHEEPEAMAISSPSHSMSMRQQARTVSITSEDI